MSPLKPTTSPSPKREYHKPQVLKIDLSSDEVLAVGCKIAGGFGVAFSSAPCVTQACSQVGS